MRMKHNVIDSDDVSVCFAILTLLTLGDQTGFEIELEAYDFFL